jgi:hypothetical protein
VVISRDPFPIVVPVAIKDLQGPSDRSETDVHFPGDLA